MEKEQTCSQQIIHGNVYINKIMSTNPQYGVKHDFNLLSFFCVQSIIQGSSLFLCCLKKGRGGSTSHDLNIRFYIPSLYTILMRWKSQVEAMHYLWSRARCHRLSKSRINTSFSPVEVHARRYTIINT